MPPPEPHGYKVGDLLWVNLEGFPWWPARVIKPSPEELRSLKMAEIPADKFVVRFFNDSDRYSLTHKENVRKFCKDKFYNRRMEVSFQGKLTKHWKGAIQEAWDYVQNRDPTDHPEAIPRPGDAPKRPSATGPGAAPSTQRRRASKTDTDRRSKKRKRAPADAAAAATATAKGSPPMSPPPSSAAITATAAPFAPAGEAAHRSDVEDNVDIPPEKEKVKKRTRKPDASRAKKESTDRDHRKPQRRRVAAILNKPTAEDDVAEGYANSTAEPLKSKPHRAAPHQPHPDQEPGNHPHLRNHPHDAPDATAGPADRLPDNKGPSVDIKPQRVKEFAPPKKTAAAAQKLPTPEKDELEGETRGEEHQQQQMHSMARDDEYNPHDEDDLAAGDDRHHDLPLPRTPEGSHPPSRAATPPQSPHHSTHDSPRKHAHQFDHEGDREYYQDDDIEHVAVIAQADAEDDAEGNVDFQTDMEPEGEIDQPSDPQFRQQSENHHFRAYEELSKSTCVQLLIAKDRALRESNMKLWKTQVKYSRKSKLYDQARFDALCARVIEVGNKFITHAEHRHVSANAPDDYFLELEEESHEVARQLGQAFFEPGSVDITESGDMLMEFVERVAPLSARIGVFVRDMVILWLDVMSLKDPVKPKRHSRNPKRSSRHRKSGKGAPVDDDVAAPNDIDAGAERTHSRASTREGPNEASAHSHDDLNRSQSSSPYAVERSPSMRSHDSERRTGHSRRRDDGHSHSDIDSHGDARDSGSRKRSRGHPRLDSRDKEDDIEAQNGGSGTPDGRSNRLDNDVEAEDSIERGKSQNSDADLDHNPNISRSYKSPSPSHSPPPSPAKSDVEMDESPKGQAIETDDARPLRQPIEEDSPHGRKQARRGARQESSQGDDEAPERKPRTSRTSIPSVKREDATATERRSDAAGGTRDKNKKNKFTQDDCKRRIEDCLSNFRKEMLGARLKKAQRSKIASKMAEELYRFDDEADGYYNANVVLMRCLQQVMRGLQDVGTGDVDNPMIVVFRECIEEPSKAKEFIDICLKDVVATSNS